MQEHPIDTAEKFEIMTPEEVARYLRKSTSWVYKNWQVLGGRKLGGSLFFPRKENLYERIFGQGKGWRYDFTLNGIRHTEAWFKTKTEAKKAEEKRKEELKKPQHEQTPTDMAFLELVNRRLDHVKAYKSEKYYTDNLYLANRWMKEWGSLQC